MSGAGGTGRLPNFIVIGAMKSGTTSLAAYLDQHPDVAVTKPKEPNFFSDPGNWDRGLSWYTSLFSSGVSFAGEASTHYTKSPSHTGAPARIHRTIPSVRLIYLIRDPIDRMRSMYVHRADKHQEPERSLERAIARDQSYVDISRYGRQLEPYLELFDENQILVVTTDELRSNPQALMSRAFLHIGADPSATVSTDEVFFSGAGKKYLSDAGLSLARILHKSGLRSLLPIDIRRRGKRWFSTEITGEHLHLDELFESELRGLLAPDMEIPRRLVEMSGAEVPSWLTGPA